MYKWVWSDLNLIRVTMTITADHVSGIGSTWLSRDTYAAALKSSGADASMAEKEQADVEMKDVSDEPKSDAEGGKEKVQEKAKDVNLLTIEGK